MPRFHTKPLGRSLAAAAVLGTGLLLTGCARTPGGLSSTNERQLVITMTVAGTIDSTDYYVVAFNTSNDKSGGSGPVPPIAANWGGQNGIVTGSATQYVLYNASNAGAGYVYGNYRGTEGNLQEVPVGVPINATPVVPNATSELSFTIPLSDLATNVSNGQVSTIATNDITYVQINFINTNQRASDTLDQLQTPKLFDALGLSNTTGTGINSYVTIPVTQDGYYSNNGPIPNTEPTTQDVGSTEGGGNVSAVPDSDAAANLDIRGWSVQVTN